MSNITETNQSFCIAPWVHSHMTPQGERQLCCITDHNFGVNVTLDEMWNGDEMKSIRKKMLNGETLSICNRCDKNVANPHTYRKYLNDRYQDLINDAIKNTDDEGGYEKYPVTFDYRTNTCNFKCKMCYEGCSSQIQNEKIKNGLKISVLSNEQRKINDDIIKNEFNNVKIYNDIVDIYWAGGEPLYWKLHWEMLDNLIKTGNSQNITLRYNTNLSVIEYNGVSIIDYIKHFKHVEFACSLDGTGDIGEWIRTNLNYDLWRNNFIKIVERRDNYKNIQIFLAVAVTTPTLFDLDNLYKLCLEFDIVPGLQTCYTGESFNLLTPLAFPKEIIKNIIDSFLKRYIDEENEIIKSFREYFSFLIDNNFHESKDDYLDKFKLAANNMDYLEKNRPHLRTSFEKILMNNKEIYDFYEKNK